MKTNQTKTIDDVVIKFAGDSGDGMQLTGSQFTNNTALTGSDLSTFPNYPAEIRAPQGTLPGVSGFQLHFSSNRIYTPGDTCDVLVAMNAAALKTNLTELKKGGIIIANIGGFDKKNLRLANYPDGENPLENDSLQNFTVYPLDITKMTKTLLKDSGLGRKEQERSKNMFVLGFLYWMYDREMENTIDFLNEKFKSKPDILQANIEVLKAGYHFGETTETFGIRYRVNKAQMEPGTYRSITGNTALAYGLIAASHKAEVPLFLGSYPITPASDILHELSRHKNFGVKTFQAEDEIAAMSAVVGAAYGGHLGVTTTSGPGLALKTEAIGLGVMLELPMVVINVQRGGPSTGLPTKTEQSDLMQAYYGRNGESPLPILAARTPADCFGIVFEAFRIAVGHMTPVIVLSDGYLANGSEPWNFPESKNLPEIEVNYASPLKEGEEKFEPYIRDENLVRPWAIPGTEGLEHRIGGLEKEDLTGNVSYVPENHQLMVETRQKKVDKVAEDIPLQDIDAGPNHGKVLVVGWGSTYGAIKSAVKDLIIQGYEVAHAHLSYIRPFPRNLGDILNNYDQILIPEMNNGQLIKLIRDEYLVDAKGYHKVMGTPMAKQELITWMKEYL